MFADRGGFDLQVGNPPWVRPAADVEALLAEGDPWWQLAENATESEKSAKRASTYSLPGVSDAVVDGVAETTAAAAYLGSAQNFAVLEGLQPDLYRCFMDLTWRNQESAGIVALVHYDTHFTDERALSLRRESYLRLRRHWHFSNELTLFEMGHKKQFSVNVYGRRSALRTSSMRHGFITRTQFCVRFSTMAPDQSQDSRTPTANGTSVHTREGCSGSTPQFSTCGLE